MVIFTAEKPLGRPGVPALSEAARATLADPSRYRLVETATYGADAMRVWERAGIGVTARFTGSVKAASATALRQGERQGGQVMKGIEAVILREVHLVGWDIVKCAF